MNNRNAIWLIPIFLLVTFPLWKIPVGNFLKPRGELNAKQQQEKDNNALQNQTFAMKKMVLHRFTDNKTTALIRAEQVYTGQDKDLIMFTDIDAKKYGDVPEDGATIAIADKGKYSQKNELLHLEGDVQVDQTVKNQHLTSEELFYNGIKQTLYSPVATKITTDKAKIAGGNFNYNIEKGEYDMGGRVKTELYDTKSSIVR